MPLALSEGQIGQLQTLREQYDHVCECVCVCQLNIDKNEKKNVCIIQQNINTTFHSLSISNTRAYHHIDPE